MRRITNFPQVLLGRFWLISLMLITSIAQAQNETPTEVKHSEVIRLVNKGLITSLDTHLTQLNLSCNLVDAVLFKQGSGWRYDLHLMTLSGEAIFLEMNAKTGEIYTPKEDITGCL